MVRVGGYSRLASCRYGTARAARIDNSTYPINSGCLYGVDLLAIRFVIVDGLKRDERTASLPSISEYRLIAHDHLNIIANQTDTTLYD